MKDNIQIVWRGIIHNNTGYSQVSRKSVIELHKLGYDIRVEPLNFDLRFSNLNEEEKSILMFLIQKKPNPNKKSVLIVHIQPDAYDIKDKVNYDKVVGFTVWETDTLPKHWIPKCNFMDAIIVPSIFNKNIFKNSGVNVPIYIARHGVSLNEFNHQGNKYHWDNAISGFKFLSVFSWQHRKGNDLLVETFLETFKSEDNVCLIIKTTGFLRTIDAKNAIEQIKLSLNLNYEPAPIYVSNEDFSNIEMAELYRDADAFVLPSRGEGVGIPFLEAAASKLPIIAPNWGGQLDFLNSENSFLVEGRLVNVDENLANFQLFKDYMKWFEVNKHSLSKTMKEVVSNKKLSKLKAAIVHNEIKKNWTWDKTINDIVTVIENIAK